LGVKESGSRPDDPDKLASSGRGVKPPEWVIASSVGASDGNCAPIVEPGSASVTRIRLLAYSCSCFSRGFQLIMCTAS
jgi:hypothetical protein